MIKIYSWVKTSQGHPTLLAQRGSAWRTEAPSRGRRSFLGPPSWLSGVRNSNLVPRYRVLPAPPALAMLLSCCCSVHVLPAPLALAVLLSCCYSRSCRATLVLLPGACAAGPARSCGATLVLLAAARCVCCRPRPPLPCYSRAACCTYTALHTAICIYSFVLLPIEMPGARAADRSSNSAAQRCERCNEQPVNWLGRTWCSGTSRSHSPVCHRCAAGRHGTALCLLPPLYNNIDARRRLADGRRASSTTPHNARDGVPAPSGAFDGFDEFHLQNRA
eukprot:SAG22_NODE_605_length_8616_cov_14.093578_2_plen_276_part_00